MGGTDNNQESQSEPRSPRQWTIEDKLRAVVQASTLSDEELGVFLRREGLHAAQLDEWRNLATDALSAPKKKARAKTSPESKRIKALEKELHRKDRALAEVTTLLALKKNSRRSEGTRTTTRSRRERPDPRPRRRGRRRRRAAE